MHGIFGYIGYIRLYMVYKVMQGILGYIRQVSLYKGY